MNEQIIYEKSLKYTDLETIYEQTSGPGGLKLAEFMALKMGLEPGKRLLDVGCNRGYLTCFLAKEFDIFAVGIDPWDDRMEGDPMIEHLKRNAEKWEVEDRVLAIQLEVPDTGFASASFDFAYSTTALEMVRGMRGEEKYIDCLKEIYRILKPGGVFGLGEPMHLDVELPADLEPLVSEGDCPWKDAFTTVQETVKAVRKAGFKILEADYAPDATDWWREFAIHDPFCKLKPEEDPKIIETDNGRWTSFGYIIARKPE